MKELLLLAMLVSNEPYAKVGEAWIKEAQCGPYPCNPNFPPQRGPYQPYYQGPIPGPSLEQIERRRQEQEYIYWEFRQWRDQPHYYPRGYPRRRY